MAEPARALAPRETAVGGWSARSSKAGLVSSPGDRAEVEAERVARAMSGGWSAGVRGGPAGVGAGPSEGAGSLSRVPVGRVMRDDDGKPKSNEEKYVDAAKKAGEAFMETDLGKKIQGAVEDDPLAKAGEAFVGTLPGKVITGTAAAGVIAALAATHRELPVPIPDLPLDRWAPGLSVSLTYEGPVDKPTKAMISFTFTEGAGHKDRTKGTSDADRYRAETARMQARLGMASHYAPGAAEDREQKEDEARLTRVLAGRVGRLPGEDRTVPSSLGMRDTGTPGGPLTGVAATPVLGAAYGAGGGSAGGLQLTSPSFGRPPRATKLLESGLVLRPMGDVPSSETRKIEDDTSATVYRRAVGGHEGGAGVSGTAAVAPAVVDAALETPSHALDAATRAAMEAGFGHDLSRVRIHTDALAARSADAVHAHAFTVADDVVFAAGAYAPHTHEGRRLLAHELAHVVQQGATRARDGDPLAVDAAGSDRDREADRAADRVSFGLPASVSVARPTRAVRRLQRAEHGTYVSTIDTEGKKYLDAGEAFYKTWGHPNVRRVSTAAAILDDLDTAKGTIEKFRIVSHGSPSGLELGLMPEIMPALFNQPAARFVDEKPFREVFIGHLLVAEGDFTRIYAALAKDTATAGLIRTMGGDMTVPPPETTLGIVLRAIVDSEWVATAQLDTGGRAPIANRAVLDAFNAMRLTTYGARLVGTASAPNQPAMQAAIAGVRAQLATVMAAASLPLPTLSTADAATLADDFMEKRAGKTGLKRSLAKGITEGAGGPYLRKLQSVQSKITTATEIEIRGCNVGKNTSLLDTYRAYFGGPTMKPSITAPDLFQFYFQLNTTSYTAAPADQAKLEAAYANPDTGIAESFDDLRRTQAGEMTRVVEETKLSELATKYRFDPAAVRLLNPEIVDPNALTPGQRVWLVRRTEVAAGIHTKLEEFCRAYLGDPYAWPAVWAANPGISDPAALKPADRLVIPPRLLKGRVAAAATTVADVTAAVRGGTAVQAYDTAKKRPVLHVDAAKEADETGRWLAAQKFDPQGRTAAVLSKKYAGGAGAYESARQGTYIQFLTRGYDPILEAIFPEDPRYDQHIVRRPPGSGSGATP